jgi:hypothetical protein
VMTHRSSAAACVLVTVMFFTSAGIAAENEITHAPTKRDWSQLARLPDWSGTWTPAPEDRYFPLGRNEPLWTEAAARQIEALKAAENAGTPQNVYINCLPEGMPSFILMTMNAFEVLFTPTRVTILGEFDANRLRRIYTDGRQHPQDLDLTFNGHSIARWEGDTLVVDTVGFLPQVYLPLGQAVALPNNGDMHIVERLRLVAADKLQDDLEITAPHMLQAPWKISRSFVRTRERRYDIVEASCRQGDFTPSIDTHGNAIFVPIEHEEGGAPLPGK